MRGELLEASRRVGIDKLGASVGLLWEVAAAFDDGDLAALRRANAEGEQWWGTRDERQLLGARVAGELRDRGGAARRGRGAVARLDRLAAQPGGRAPPAGGARPRAGRGDGDGDPGGWRSSVSTGTRAPDLTPR